jgi:DNA-binding transcriptional regulator YhcF (GntR family)
LIQQQIVERIAAAELPLSTRQLAIDLGYSWNTIQRHCLELLFRSNIERLELAGSHLWMSIGSYKKETKEEETKEAIVTPEIKETRKGIIDKLLEKEIDQQVTVLLEKEIEKEIGIQEETRTKEREEKQRQEKEESKVVRHD